jgi:hypothetical protein
MMPFHMSDSGVGGRNVGFMGNGYKEAAVMLEFHRTESQDELNYFTTKPISLLISLFESLAG